MRCPKCDSVMPIGAKVCKNCNFNAFTNQYESGSARPVQQAPVSRPAPQRPSAPPPQRPAVNPTPAPKPIQQKAPAKAPAASNPKPQKAKKALITILTIICAATVGTISRNLTRDLVTGNARKPLSNNSVIQETPKAKDPSPEFNALLAEKGISYTRKIWTRDSECFVKAQDEQTVEVLEIGYEGDIVKEQYSTAYFDVSSITEAQIQQIESEMKNLYETNMSYAATEISRSGKFLVVQLHVDNMDSSQTISAMAASGQVALVNGEIPDKISITGSRQGLLANGYIQ